MEDFIVVEYARVRPDQKSDRSSKFLPNVKDEPRPWLARRVHRDDLNSDFSFENA